MYVVIELPFLARIKDYHERYGFSWKWANNVGFRIIKRVEFELNNKIIQSFTGLYLDVFWKKQNTCNHNIDVLVGNTSENTEFTPDKKSTKLYIPIPFWFTREYGNSFPVNVLDMNNVKINVEFNDFESIIEYGPSHSIQISESSVSLQKYDTIYQPVSGAIGRFFHFDPDKRLLYYTPLSNQSFAVNTKTHEENIVSFHSDESYFITNKDQTLLYTPTNSNKKLELSIKNDVLLDIISAKLQISYIFLSKEEQELMKKKKTFHYTIQQTQYIEFVGIKNIKKRMTINAKNNVYEILWVVSTDGFQHFEDIVSTNTIYINGSDILTKRNSDYNRVIQHVDHYHSNYMFDQNIYCYSFSMNADSYQPSGSLNMSKIERCELGLDFYPSITKSKDVVIFVNSYNTLIIKDKKVSLLF